MMHADAFEAIIDLTVSALGLMISNHSEALIASASHDSGDISAPVSSG